MPPVANGKGKLAVRHGNLANVGTVLCRFNLKHCRRFKRRCNELCRVFAVFDNVHLLSAKLVEDVGNTRAARTNADTVSDNLRVM